MHWYPGVFAGFGWDGGLIENSNVNVKLGQVENSDPFHFYYF
jgi:hypothetical protein